MCFTRVYLQLWKLLTRFSFCVLTLFLHWSNVICDPRGLLCFFHFSFFISFNFGWISWMSTQLVSFSRFDALRFSLSTASCLYVNLSFDTKMNFARAFKISIDARRRRWYGVVVSDQVWVNRYLMFSYYGLPAILEATHVVSLHVLTLFLY